MKDFVSYSQAGQDRFAYDLIGPSGTFLDIGASDPIKWSNSYGLELMGWGGWLMDIEHDLVEKLEEVRAWRNMIFECNAVDFPWMEEIVTSRPGRLDFDFLSLDIDQYTVPCLRNMPLHYMAFKVITVEHDLYSAGPEPKKEIHQILSNAGYVLIREDVCATLGYPYENWYVCPELAEKARSLP